MYLYMYLLYIIINKIIYVNTHVCLILSIAVCRISISESYILNRNIAVFRTEYSTADECFDRCLSYPGCNSIDYEIDDGECFLSDETTRTQPLVSDAETMFIERCVSI